MMKKRSFLKKLSFVACVLSISLSINAFKNGGSEKFVGIQLYSVREDMKKDVTGTIQKMGEIGFKFVETAGYSDGKFYGMEPADFKNLVEKNGMKFISSHTGQPAPNAEQWDSSMRWWDKCIAAHKAAGVQYIVQPYMTKEAFESLAALANYCKYFNAIGEKCRQNGIRFGYHNHDKEFTAINDTMIYDYMLQNTKPELVTFQLDLYWIVKGGKNAIDYFKKYPGRFELYHVKDEAELGGAGTMMNFKPYFENAELAGMKYYIVEVERYNFSPVESAQKSFEFIKKADYIK